MLDKLVQKGYIEKGTGPREIKIIHTASSEPQPGLYAKYTVINKENGQQVDNCFVLRPDRDPAARSTLMQYALVCGKEELALDIQRWIDHLSKETEGIS
ncbi:hypothetical protein AWM70_00090 [Paenibacillus yonginensis]|uniref:Uncharacterized protein n=1 Tax=Paenibacillus yonginensis TaxID=1462996 RepID=A0A1B1MVI4_9BACL|nr:hypothetical protein [Paenibacillus yonginensis]ANS73179.1 hypothetical protein AWM70_00090 [Paenibacillus yonginensis]